MNVNDQWMLERMQQMAASMATALPQTGQNGEFSKTEKGESFQDLVNKAKDQKVEAPKKAGSPKKAENTQKTESKTVTNMKDPRIKALDPETQAKIAAGFLTPIELPDGSLLLEINTEASAVVVPLLPDGQADWSKPITLVNNNGDEFEVWLDLENGDHKLFQVMDNGEKQPIDLFPEQPKFSLLDDLKNLNMTVTTTNVETAEEQTDDEDMTDLDGSAVDAKPLFKDVKAAPVKVGENFQLDTEEPNMDAQLANTIQQAAQQGLRQIEIKLSPENLGALTIKLTQSSDGLLQVVLHTANAKAANLLTQHMDGLNLALQSYGQVKVEVQRGEDSQQAEQQAQHQTNPDGHNQHNQQQQQHRQDHEHSQDFIQRLRLGLYGDIL